MRGRLENFLGAIVCFLALCCLPMEACAVVGEIKYSADTFVQSEKAVIIWDAEHKVEHFIRQADILTSDTNIGFLVPTPNPPELVEADTKIFDLADYVARPEKVPYVDAHSPLSTIAPILEGPMIFMALGGQVKGVYSTINTQLADVSNLGEQDIAGYHAVILRADDPKALEQWLKENGYSWPAGGEEWLKPYIAAKWTIAAFKLIKPVPKTPQPDDQNLLAQKLPIVTHAIRMSFSTEKPFFPYSEPGDRQNATNASSYGRTLRVSILSNEKMSGTLGDKASWPGQLQYAGSSAAEGDPQWNSGQWLSFAKLDGPKYQLTLPTHLTSFRDDSNPRPGTADLYFSAAADQSPFRATEFDSSLPTIHRLDFSNPLSDFFTLVILVLVPGSFIYCGRRLLQLYWIGSTESLPPVARADRLCGFITFVLGCYPGLTYVLLAFVFIPAALLSGVPDGLSLMSRILYLAAAVACAATWLSVLICGSRIFDYRRPRTTPDSKPLPEGLKPAPYLSHAVIGYGSIIAGILFLCTVLACLILAMPLGI
jgi:hypothetical protein